MATKANHKKGNVQSEVNTVEQFLASNLGTSKELNADANAMLEEFFENYHLKEVWEYLEDWFEAGITNELAYQKGNDRSDLIHFKKSIWNLSVAAFQLYSAQQQAHVGQ